MDHSNMKMDMMKKNSSNSSHMDMPHMMKVINISRLFLCVKRSQISLLGAPFYFH